VTQRILGADEATLRRDRTSVKWMAYPPDVLPLWVAEMDAAPCPAVVDAVTAAVRRGDTGYGWAPRYAAAVGRYARDAWGWEVALDATMVVADVMIGASEVLRLLTDELRGGIVAAGMPLFAAGINPASPAANGPGVVGAPVTVGGQHVRPGAIIVGDADGVVVVPIDRAAAVLERLQAIRKAEAATIADVEAGLTATNRMRDLVAAARIIGP